MITPVCKVGTETIPVIRDLVERTWKAADIAVISPEQVNYMLDLFYNEASLKKQMEDGQQFIVAKEQNKVIGFASYSVYPDPGAETLCSQVSGDVKSRTIEVFTNVYRLHQIYMDPDHQGKGIGKLLIGFIINDISFQDAKHLELNVNRYNKAVEFYQKIGFKIIREEYTNIGNGYFMNDYVMNLALKTYPYTS